MITSTQTTPKTAQGTALYTIRWVLAHDPPAVFEDAAEWFCETVRERTGGDVEVELATTKEFDIARGKKHSQTELIACVERGEIEMAHTYVSALGAFHNKLWAVELPFLFRDYGHAGKVLQGPIGEGLMAGLLNRNLRGLGFAYSGGYRIIPSTGRRVTAISDFQDMSIRTAANPVPRYLFESLGAKTMDAPLQDIASLTKEGRIDAAELTYVRFLSTGLQDVYKIVNDTGHSLFTTMMVVNERFFQELPDKFKAVIVEAGAEACRLERETALEEEVKAKAACPEHGVEIVTMGPEKREEFRERALRIYDRFAPELGEDLIESIRSTV